MKCIYSALNKRNVVVSGPHKIFKQFKYQVHFQIFIFMGTVLICSVVNLGSRSL